MKHLLLPIIFLLVSEVSGFQMDPPVWPEHFSQSFHIKTTSSNQTGRLWYDYSIQKYRYDFDHPDKTTICNQFSQYNSPCTQLWSNNKIYTFVPEKQMCCFFDSDWQQNVLQRDWLKVLNYTFTGQVQLDGQYFYRWSRLNQSTIEYLADKSDKMIPKRDARGDKFFTFDFWLDSYTDDVINQNVFNVPDYCVKDCRHYTKQQEQQKKGNFGSRSISEFFQTQIHTIQKNFNQLKTNQS